MNTGAQQWCVALPQRTDHATPLPPPPTPTLRAADGVMAGCSMSRVLSEIVMLLNNPYPGNP